MATSDFTVISTEQSRAGAAAALAALRDIRKIGIEADDQIRSHGEHPIEAWFNSSDQVVAEMLRAAGGPGQFLAGFIAALAEYAKTTEEGILIDVTRWMPEAAMTDQEKFRARARMRSEAEKVGNELRTDQSH